MWLCGDPDNGVPPLSKVTTSHLKGHAMQHRRVAADMKYLMSHVKHVAQPRNAWRSLPGEWIIQKTLALYESVKALFMFKGRNGALRTRFQEFSWRTIVNLVRNHKGILVGEEPLPSEETNEESIAENNEEFHDCV